MIQHESAKKENEDEQNENKKTEEISAHRQVSSQ